MNKISKIKSLEEISFDLNSPDGKFKIPEELDKLTNLKTIYLNLPGLKFNLNELKRLGKVKNLKNFIINWIKSN